MLARFICIAIIYSTVLSNGMTVLAQTTRFERSWSRSPYLHLIDLYDVNGRKIDPNNPQSGPVSTKATCSRCHDISKISHGFHFSMGREATVEGEEKSARREAEANRQMQPWFWVDPKTGTQLPVSLRGEPGTYSPQELGISDWDFALMFGAYMPGGTPLGVMEKGEISELTDSTSRWPLSGSLEIDCLICHAGETAYQFKARMDQIEQQNFAWATTAALGLGKISGSTKSLPLDFDPASVTDETPSSKKLPTVVYDATRFDADGKFMMDVVRMPKNESCYRCHTDMSMDPAAGPRWNHDQDVHIRAGMNCVDCHRNGLSHDMTRGFPGEAPHEGVSVTTLSCRGCHLGESNDAEKLPNLGGRLGAPKPLHEGIPPVHFDKMSCTSCHSGRLPADEPFFEMTSRNSRLGFKSHHAMKDSPEILSPVWIQDATGRLVPNRVAWPAFWGTLQGDELSPLPPADVATKLRSPLRVRRDFRSEVTDVRLSSSDKKEVLGDDRARTPLEELTEEEKEKLDVRQREVALKTFEEKLVKALTVLKEDVDVAGDPVFVSNGQVYKLSGEDKLEMVRHESADPVAWPVAHDVRPARLALGANGCRQCHSEDAPIFYGTVTAQGPAPVAKPVTYAMHELQDRDPVLLAAWSESFSARTEFKWTAVALVGIVAFVILMFAMFAFQRICCSGGRE